MEYLIYILAGISIILSLGGFSYVGPKKKWAVLTSLVSLIFSISAIIYVSIWPIIIGFAINWGFRLIGLEPSNSEVTSGLDHDDNQNT